MADTYLTEDLSFTDAFFLYLERSGAPLNVASIGAFEGEIPLDFFADYVESKLPLIPRFLQKVVMAPFGIGSPTWQFDRHFDVRNHVHEVRLKHGTESEWKAAVSELMSTHLDRARPLWDLTLFRGLKNKRTGLVVRCHHCLIDGVAGVGMLRVLLDPNPTPQPLPPKKRRPPAPQSHETGATLLDGLVSCCFSTAQALLTVHSELLRMAEQGSHPNGNSTHAEAQNHASGPLARLAPLGDLAKLLAELAQPTQRLPFNVLCHGPQKFEWTEVSMAEISAIKEACGATLNEVVLSVLTATLQRYAEVHELTVKGRKLRLVVPVDVRSEGEGSGMGNHITFLPVDITMGERAPRKLLSLVQRRSGFSRTAHGAELVALMGVVISALPPALQSMTGSMLAQLPISVCNSICTNVHGPNAPLYLCGHKMLSNYPYVPIGGEMGMNCAVLSYNGVLFVGFTGDAVAIPDISLLPKFFAASFAELRSSAGVRKAKVTGTRPAVRKVSAKVEEDATSGQVLTPEKVAEAAVA